MALMKWQHRPRGDIPTSALGSKVKLCMLLSCLLAPGIIDVSRKSPPPDHTALRSMSAMLKHFAARECSNPSCRIEEDQIDSRNGETLKNCGRCRANNESAPAVYCSQACQRAHWPTHKKECKEGQARHSVLSWQDRFRLCRDKNRHFGTLELITWDGVHPDLDDMALGWGGVFRDEAAQLREKFEKEYARDEARFCEYRPEAFRWTCCGMSAAEGIHGCDHHGHPDAPFACTCDFCRGGEPLPQNIYDEIVRSQPAQGLQLRRGPGARSGRRIMMLF